jgi:hypothetical protein
MTNGVSGSTPGLAADDARRRKRQAVELLRQSLFNCTPAKAEAVIEAVAMAFGIEPVDRAGPLRPES